MTREEAIQILSTRDAHGVLCGYTSGVTEALDMAIEALQKDIVRCKDCCHRVHDEDRNLYYCEKYYGQGDVSDENFCQWGEMEVE